MNNTYMKESIFLIRKIEEGKISFDSLKINSSIFHSDYAFSREAKSLLFFEADE